MRTHAQLPRTQKKEHPERRAVEDRSARDRDDQNWAASRFADHARRGFSQIGPRDVMGLQGLVGNRVVASLAADRDRTVHPENQARHESTARATTRGAATYGTASSSFTMSAIFRGGPRTSSTSAALDSVRDADSADGKAPKPVVTKKKPGQIEIKESDAVVPALTYGSNIGIGSDAPGSHEFGATTTFITVTDVDVEQVTPQAPRAASPGLGKRMMGLFQRSRGAKPGASAAPESAPAPAHFRATATVNVTSLYAVHDLGRTNISSGSCPAVTADNYEEIAADLTPDMSSDGGRPNRTAYWAKDLTLLHEKFHATERTGRYGQAAFDVAKNWLQAQSASNANDVQDALNMIPDKMCDSYSASFVPGKETRAYGDGAPFYTARVAAVRARGQRLAAAQNGAARTAGPDAAAAGAASGAPTDGGPPSPVPASAAPSGGGSGRKP